MLKAALLDSFPQENTEIRQTDGYLRRTPADKRALTKPCREPVLTVRKFSASELKSGWKNWMIRKMDLEQSYRSPFCPEAINDTTRTNLGKTKYHMISVSSGAAAMVVLQN